MLSNQTPVSRPIHRSTASSGTVIESAALLVTEPVERILRTATGSIREPCHQTPVDADATSRLTVKERLSARLLLDEVSYLREHQACSLRGVITIASENASANRSGVPKMAPMRSVYLATYSGTWSAGR